ncbi:aminopeptidase [Filifactor villosus]|uniref:M18 family aminopeptidase n=1 Tax=Filifactor villosus TaxID=29374 RepID=A0ABV9QLX6_9FIRM
MEQKNGWKSMSENQLIEIEHYSKEYMDFLDASKTERTCAKEIVRLAMEQGYKDLSHYQKAGSLKAGDKVVVDHKGKAVLLFVIGEEELQKGIYVVGSHIDSPRLDLKPNPLYEEGNMAFLKTHYYGGIKKYQWGCVPLAMYGVIYTKDGQKIEICIGDKEEDPVFCVNDLLIHLSAKQMEKKASEVIEGEQLNVVFGHIPLKEEEKDAVKQNILNLLLKQYNIEEKSFLSAEIELVPAGKSRYVGLDRGLVGGYGQDDRVCTFAAMKAIFGIKTPKRTACTLFADKEEIGSTGNTGMDSLLLENVVSELVELQNEYCCLKVRRCLGSAKVLSADVNVAYDPNFPEVTDKMNVAYMGEGVCVTKYTGAGGKGGSSDANAEFLHEVISKFDEKGIVWQTGELGKVDAGGGGTIACYLARYGAEVLDCGTAVLNMHSPFELSSKLDIYMTSEAYRVFLEN